MGLIGIVDYGMGNVGSIVNMLKRIGTDAVVSSVPQVLGCADKLILPGVGAFDRGMTNLSALGLKPLLDEIVLCKRTPVLGICLGMQLLGKRSEEGRLPGLGWVDAETVRFRPALPERTLKVPHMGWSTTRLARPHGLFEGLNDARFYFVHSYYVRCLDSGTPIAWATHGIEFAAALSQGHIQGVQFHPEKSHRFGMTLLRNFVMAAT